MYGEAYGKRVAALDAEYRVKKRRWQRNTGDPWTDIGKTFPEYR
jgi:hypothetical protein